MQQNNYPAFQEHKNKLEKFMGIVNDFAEK
jgi:hypothetical protein